MEYKAKEPWLAVFLNYLFPGLGYFYAQREIRAAIAIIIAFSISSLAIFGYHAFAKNDMPVTPLLLIVLAIFFGFCFLFNIFVLIDGYLCTRKYNTSAGIKPSNVGIRVAAIIGIVFLFMTAGILPAIYIRTNIMQAFKIPTTTMMPTLKPGDRIIVDKRAYLQSKPQRGDVIVFIPPLDTKKYYVKRIIGLPGEEVEIKNGNVYINDAMVSHPKIANNFYYNQGDYAKEGKKTIIPANSYYVLGDNSISSADSRFWGFVKTKAIKGKVTKIFWPLERSGKVE
jgi:signal peptidase I